MADLSALDDYIERIRSLPDIGKEAAPEVATAVEAELKRQIAAGQNPDGVAWKLTREGERPLAGAGASLGVAAVGSRVVMRLWGHIARHNNGRAKGGIERRILPTGKVVPPALASVVKDKFLKVVARHMGGE